MRKDPVSLEALMEGNAGHRPVHEVREQIDGVEKILALEPRARVLDLACGTGHQTLELSRRGYRVLGIDPSFDSIHEARAAARAERLNVHFLKCDARAIAYRAEFDAVVALSGTLGRFAEERESLKALSAVKTGLKPGGKLLIDLLNREWLVRHLSSGRRELERFSFDLETGRLNAARSSLRVYGLTEVKGLLAQAGLSYRRSWGGFDGSAYEFDSPRLIVLAEKGHESARPARQAQDALPTAIRIKGRR